MGSAMNKIRVRHFSTHSHVVKIDAEDENLLKTAPMTGYVDIAYRIVGNGPEKVVFVSGMCVSHEMWDFQEQSLQLNPLFTLIFIDNRGSGNSSCPSTHPQINGPLSTSIPSSSSCYSTYNVSTDSDSESESENEVEEHCSETGVITEKADELAEINKFNGYTIEAMSRDVWAVINTIFDKTTYVHLIGHSMGSMIVQRAALNNENGNRVGSLTLLCGHDGGVFWNNIPSVSLLKSVIMHTLANKFNNIIMQTDIYLNLHFTSSYIKSNKNMLRKRYINDIHMNESITMNNKANVWDHYLVVRSHYLSPKDALILRNRPYPKVVIYGMYDNVVLPRASRQLAGRIGAKVIPVKAAHFAMEEAYVEINELIERHIGQASLLRNVAMGRALPLNM